MRAGAFSKSGPRPRPRLPVHARLPSRMAYEKEAGSDSVRRGRSACRPGAARLAGRTRQAIALGPEQKPRAKARRARRPFTAFLALLADLATVLLNDVSIGNSESFKLAAAPAPGRKKAFDPHGVNPRSMFPKAGWQDSPNCFPAKGSLPFCAVKFRLKI